MRKLMLGLMALGFFISTQAFAKQNSQCTSWEKRNDSTSCQYNGRKAYFYERQCENHCWYNNRTRQGNMGRDCNRQKLCFTSNPKKLRSTCSPWIRDNATCTNPDSQRREQKWVRVCQKGYDEKRCSNKKPRN